MNTQQATIDAIEDNHRDNTKDIYVQVTTGKITTYEQLWVSLSAEDDRYADELDAIDSTPSMLSTTELDMINDAEEAGIDIKEYAWNHLNNSRKVRSAIKEYENKIVFANEDGHPCDEHGVRLSSDLEHRVFEVIPGGKK